MHKIPEVTLEKFKTKGYPLTVVKLLPSGKEASLYAVESNGNIYALKVYKASNKRAFKRDHEYLAGKYLRRRSDRKAMGARSRYGKKLIQRLWVKREFFLLRKLRSLGASVPAPVEMTVDSILMDFVGSEEEPAILLKDAELSRKEAMVIYKEIMRNIRIFDDVGIVHGDLSPYNILYSEGQVIIIDFPQAIDVRNNPNKQELKTRDLENIEKWYAKYK